MITHHLHSGEQGCEIQLPSITFVFLENFWYYNLMEGYATRKFLVMAFLECSKCKDCGEEGAL